MNSGQRYFGMTLAQIGILAALALVACVVIGILGSMMLNLAPNTEAEPTYTLQPSPTAVLTSTPWPTVTPIPNWQEYSFSEGQARIWLPASYTGGDTVTSSDAIMEKLRATFDDEAFANDIQGLIEIPEVGFFAFDAGSTSLIRFMYIGSETLNPDVALSMDYYLNRMMDDFTGANDRVVERQIAQLDHHQAGKLVVESRIPAGDVDFFVTVAAYMIKVENTMWFITFRTGRDEYVNQQPVMEASVNSFWVQP